MGVKYIPQQVIAGQLLAALDDKDKVAIVADEHMLDTLAIALKGHLVSNCRRPDRRKQVEDMLLGLKQLGHEAFGWGNPEAASVMSDTITWPLNETAECGMCRHIGNVGDFIASDDDGDKWSECPKCGMVEESTPMWDEEDIARYENQSGRASNG